MDISFFASLTVFSFSQLLSNEIKDIMDQISEGERSICKIDKIRKRLEAGKLELQSIEKEAPLPATPRPR